MRLHTRATCAHTPHTWARAMVHARTSANTPPVANKQIRLWPLLSEKKVSCTPYTTAPQFIHHCTCTERTTCTRVRLHTRTYSQVHKFTIVRAQTPYSFWTNVANQRRFFDWLSVEFRITEPHMWHSKTAWDVRQWGGTTLLR